MVARLTPLQKAACSNHVSANFFISFLRVDAFELLYVCMQGKHHNMRPGGAMVARLTPVQKVACSNHVRVNFYFNF